MLKYLNAKKNKHKLFLYFRHKWVWPISKFSATWSNMKLVHLPLMGELLHLVQRGWDWVGPQPAQAPPRCTKRNSSPINGQCTNHRIAV